jgi:hypothetical protein
VPVKKKRRNTNETRAKRSEIKAQFASASMTLTPVASEPPAVWRSGL